MREGFDFWTSARLEEAADHIALMRGRLTRTIFSTLEMNLCLSSGVGQGILFRRAKSIARLTDTIFWGSMHTLYASGGAAQYECNQYVLAIRGVGISWAQLEDLKNKFVFCPGRGHLKKFIIEERIVNGNGSHLRGFASEVLMLVKMLSVFGHMVLSPMGLLARETRCIYLLDRLGDFLKLGRLNPQQAFALNFEHHNLFVSLYPGCAKPKIHYIWHCVQDRFTHGVSLDCFAAERQHKFTKRLGAFCCRDMTRTFLARAAKNMLEGFEQERVLGKCLMRPPARRIALARGPPQLGERLASRAMRGPFGTIEAKQFVLWKEGVAPYTRAGGEVIKCLATQGGQHYLLVSAFRSDDDDKVWLPASDRVIVPLENIIELSFYIMDNDMRIVA